MQATKTQDTKVQSGITTVVNKFEIQTNLKNREEAFRMQALAEATGLPLLFIGVPGTAKTQSVRDYANARIAGGGKLFILELDEYTRPAEVKGRPNMAKLVDKDNPTYEVISHIADADYIVMNEIDKANGGMRNSMLSIMAERKLFNGNVTLDLGYKCFVGTCNSIPKEERANPFWDRFILKCTLPRMTVDQLLDYHSSGHKMFRQKVSIKVPTAEEMEKGTGKTVPGYKMAKLVALCYDHCSDRTISFLPRIITAVSFIWGGNVDNALIKTAEILLGGTLAGQLANEIISKEMKVIADKIQLIPGITDMTTLSRIVQEIQVLVTNYSKDKKLAPESIVEIEEALTKELDAKGVDFGDLKSRMGIK